jgi:transcriptional regulator with XRE-family HTH domain
MSFAQNLKQVRLIRNMTQQELASILNVSRATIAGYETKNKQPDYDKLLQIADIFEISTDYLLGRELQSETDKKMEYLSSNEFRFMSDYRLLTP